MSNKVKKIIVESLMGSNDQRDALGRPRYHSLQRTLEPRVAQKAAAGKLCRLMALAGG